MNAHVPHGEMKSILWCFYCVTDTESGIHSYLYFAWSVCHRSGVMDFWYRFKLDFSFYGSDTPNLSHLNEVQVIYEETFSPKHKPCFHQNP